MSEYITKDEVSELLISILYRVEQGNIEECADFLTHALSDINESKLDIDRKYIVHMNEKRKKNRIDDIDRLLKEMTLQQIENVHKYASDEYDEPNHEAEALDAIIQLSKKNRCNR